MEITEEKYRILTKYLSLLIDEKDYIAKEDLILILEALEKNIVLEGDENEWTSNKRINSFNNFKYI